MLQSIIHLVSNSAEAGIAAGHAPQTAVAAVMCAMLVSLFS